VLDGTLMKGWGEREREGIFSISHPSPQPILGEMPSLSPSGCTIMHFQLWLKIFKPKV